MAGRPETLNHTDFGLPEVKTVLMLVETADPWLVATLPELAIVKSKFLLVATLPELAIVKSKFWVMTTAS